ncbi:DUF4873 domain-containing protein [Rhodococcus spongiicola]|uniref:DUF4873 domain-containing protein n=1 Tax=Rhodococcus spongiicola TaxID=2487352 RepID=A0A3S3AD00_9NOCA|nr:DUF4873 domain-containing protein [Rhodococcus spongiicola]RVW01614.1 DUF4873 domain-containing protein [Rhodococcus spongiicola]
MAGYRGPAHVTVADQHPVIVGVELSGNFEPISGRFVWRGRVRELTHALGSPNAVASGTELVITTPTASGVARVSGTDLWGNHMVDGVTRPPFPALEDPFPGTEDTEGVL